MDNFKYAQELIKQEGWEVDLWTGERLEGKAVSSKIKCRADD